jgi:thioredoxin reductase (NADPH)
LRYRELDVPGEKRLSGHGVSWCATCEGFFFRETRHRRDRRRRFGHGGGNLPDRVRPVRYHRAPPRLAARIQDHAAARHVQPKIEFAWGSEVAEVLGEDRVSGLRLRNVKTGEESILPVTGIFIAISHDPRSEMFAGQLPMNAGGYLEAEHPTARTVIGGVFAAGGVVDHIYRQAVTAAGTGCAAVLDAERWLADHED